MILLEGFFLILTLTFQELFRNWVNSFSKNIGKGVISIDGRSSRYSFDLLSPQILESIAPAAAA